MAKKAKSRAIVRKRLRTLRRSSFGNTTNTFLIKGVISLENTLKYCHLEIG